MNGLEDMIQFPQFVDDFMQRQFTDKQVGRFYVGHSTNSKKRLSQLITEMICEITGGSAKYVGRDMRTAHAGLGITGAIGCNCEEPGRFA